VGEGERGWGSSKIILSDVHLLVHSVENLTLFMYMGTSGLVRDADSKTETAEKIYNCTYYINCPVGA
jgi:hypothetical protein